MDQRNFNQNGPFFVIIQIIFFLFGESGGEMVQGASPGGKALWLAIEMPKAGVAASIIYIFSNIK